jgi:hypothetical protein
MEWKQKKSGPDYLKESCICHQSRNHLQTHASASFNVGERWASNEEKIGSSGLAHDSNNVRQK